MTGEAKSLKTLGFLPIIRLMRKMSGAQQHGFRLRVPIRARMPHGVLPWLRWALDFRGRAAVRAYLRECEARIAAQFPREEAERISQELVCFGRAEIRGAASPLES